MTYSDHMALTVRCLERALISYKRGNFEGCKLWEMRAARHERSADMMQKELAA